jgi:formiminotetrahydrofolate cyclodeaminase
VIKAPQASIRDFAIRMFNLRRGIASHAAAHGGGGGEAFSGKMARG